MFVLDPERLDEADWRQATVLRGPEEVLLVLKVGPIRLAGCVAGEIRERIVVLLVRLVRAEWITARGGVASAIRPRGKRIRIAAVRAWAVRVAAARSVAGG